MSSFSPPFVNPTNSMPHIQMASPAMAHTWNTMTPLSVTCQSSVSVSPTTGSVYLQPRTTSWGSPIFTDLRKKSLCKRRLEENVSDLPNPKVFINEEHMALRMRSLSIDNNNTELQPNLQDGCWYVNSAGNQAERPLPITHQCSVTPQLPVTPSVTYTQSLTPQQQQLLVSRQARNALYAKTRLTFEELEDRIENGSDVEFDDIDSENEMPRLTFTDAMKDCQDNIEAKDIIPKVLIDHFRQSSNQRCMDLVLWKPPSDPIQDILHPAPTVTTQTAPKAILMSHECNNPPLTADMEDTRHISNVTEHTNNNNYNGIDYGSQMMLAASIPLPIDDDDMEL